MLVLCSILELFFCELFEVWIFMFIVLVCTQLVSRSTNIFKFKYVFYIWICERFFGWNIFYLIFEGLSTQIDHGYFVPFKRSGTSINAILGKRYPNLVSRYQSKIIAYLLLSDSFTWHSHVTFFSCWFMVSIN